MKVRRRWNARAEARRSGAGRSKLGMVDIAPLSPNALCTFRPDLSGVRPVTRTLAVIATLCAVALGSTACSSSSGTHTQSLSPTPSGSSDTPSSPSVSSSATTGSAPGSEVPTPTVTPPAQDAVDAYVADFNEGIRASRDPAHADLVWISKYETGKARVQTQQSFTYTRAHQLAFRGAAPDPNVKVRSLLSSSAVILTSCLVIDNSDPWVEYDTATGKAVPTGTPRNPPPPYLLTIFMKATSGANWKISSVVQDTSKTCKG